MRKPVLVVLFILGLVLSTTFRLAPAQATTPDSQVYTWGFVRPGSQQLVCKQITIHPEKEVVSPASHHKSVKMSSRSTIVEDRYCSHLTKPSL
jgi:hypothetical protein